MVDYDRVRTYVVPEGLKNFTVCVFAKCFVIFVGSLLSEGGQERLGETRCDPVTDSCPACQTCAIPIHPRQYKANDPFKLTPFVTNKIQPMRGSYGSRKMQPISGHNYLAKWKKENGED